MIRTLCAFLGLLYLKEQVDREKVSQYNLTISARDLATPALKSSHQFTVNIVDINDNPVHFVGPFDDSGLTLVANVSENMPIGTYITTVLINYVPTHLWGEELYNQLGFLCNQ